MELEKVKCPYCGTATTVLHRSRKMYSCECGRMYRHTDLNGKIYNVIYKKDGTKEVIQ